MIKIFQSHQDNIFVCNTSDERQFVRVVITNYMKTCLSAYLYANIINLLMFFYLFTQTWIM